MQIRASRATARWVDSQRETHTHKHMQPGLPEAGKSFNVGAAPEGGGVAGTSGMDILLVIRKRVLTCNFGVGITHLDAEIMEAP